MNVESVQVSPVKEDGDTEESWASGIEDGRKDADDETTPEVINKHLFHLLVPGLH